MSDFLPDEDKDIALDYIILNLLHKALDKDIDAIKKSKLKLKEQHSLMMESVQRLVEKDAKEVKRQMSKKGIKVFDMTPINEDFVRYEYIIRGYQSEFRFLKVALKMHTDKKLAHYYGTIQRNQ